MQIDGVNSLQMLHSFCLASSIWREAEGYEGGRVGGRREGRKEGWEGRMEGREGREGGQGGTDLIYLSPLLMVLIYRKAGMTGLRRAR